MGAPTHTDLIGLDDNELLKLAPKATHQHYKGGLYRDLGTIYHTEDLAGNTRPLRSERYRGYLHLYPHDKDAWIRSAKEFDLPHEGAPRFRPLAGADTEIEDRRINYGRVRDADTGNAYVKDGKEYDLVTEDGIVLLVQRWPESR